MRPRLLHYPSRRFVGSKCRLEPQSVYRQSGEFVERGQGCSDSGDHIVEDALELYALGRLTDEGQLAVVEKHLLDCEACRERLREENAFVRLLRAALRRV